MGETRTDQQTATDRPGALGWTTRGDLAALTRPGAGAPVVVVHGVMADAEAWRPVAEAIAPERPVLVPNRRGRRPGPGTGAGYGLDREVEDLTAWLRGIAEPADVVAHSYGGLVALEAVRRGAPARSLVLYEPVARPFGDHVLPRLRAALAAEDLDTAVEMSTSTCPATRASTSHSCGAHRRGRGCASSRSRRPRSSARSSGSRSTRPATARSVSRSPWSRASSAATARRTEARWSACAPRSVSTTSRCCPVRTISRT